MSPSPHPPPTTDRHTSHGRGGAGNIASPRSPALQPTDLATPTIKQATYTTGRGGTGNMASNDKTNPAAARAAQDVDVPPAHLARRDVAATDARFFVGRGGEGNLARVGDGSGKGGTGTTGTVTAAASGASAEVNGANGAGGGRKGAVEKGREMIGAALGRTRTREEDKK